MQNREEIVTVKENLELIPIEMEHSFKVRLTASQYVKFQRIRMDLWSMIPDRRIPSYAEVIDYLVTLYTTTPEEVEESIAKAHKGRVEAAGIHSPMDSEHIQGFVQEE